MQTRSLNFAHALIIESMRLQFMKLNRRDFARLGAAGLAAHVMPDLTAQAPEKKTDMRSSDWAHRRTLHARCEGQFPLANHWPGQRPS